MLEHLWARLMACSPVLTATVTFEGPFADLNALRALMREFSSLYDDLLDDKHPEGVVIGQATRERLKVRCVSRSKVKELARRVAELRVESPARAA
jgi:hypothetical protein